MYLNRLLQDIGYEDEVVSYKDYMGYMKGFHGYYINTVDGHFSLSDILIKNIDKIDSLSNNGMRETTIIRLFMAIQEDKLEEWAESLYNNK